MHIRLIESEEDDGNESACTEISCVATDSASERKFAFELAIPDDLSNEIEYLPDDTLANDVKLPSYLQVWGTITCWFLTTESDSKSNLCLFVLLIGRTQLQAIRALQILENRS